MSDDGSTVISSAEEIARENEALRAQVAAANAERDAERTAREAESRRADGLYSRVATADRQLAGAQVSGLAAQEAQAESTITAITNERAALRKEHSNLLAEGKFDEASEINEKMADAAARLNQAQQAKTYFSQQRETASKQPVDPVERFLAQNQNFTEKERDWIRANPRYATDTDFQGRVNRAHADLVAKGTAPQSTDYFQGLEQAGYMRSAPQIAADSPLVARASGGAADAGQEPTADDPYSGAAAAPVEEPVQTPRPQARGQVAAAPSHRAPATPGARPAPARVNLTPEQAEAALAASEYFPDEVKNGGEAEIYAYWHKLNTSSMARRMRDNWSAGA